MTMTRALSLLLILAAACVPNSGQEVRPQAASTLKAFDVVSVRENKSGERGSRYGWTPDGFSMTNVPLNRLITFAFMVRSPKYISGLPGWTDSARFDVQAKLDEGQLAALKGLPPIEARQVRYTMLQQVILDRFNFKIRHVQKDFPAYALVVGKDGSKLRETSNSDNSKQSSARDGDIALTAVPISIFVRALSNFVDREVVDQTGLTARYDIALKWAPQSTADWTDKSASVDVGPSIFTALQEQLGLRLAPTQPTSADTIAVDHIEMPTEN